jgi:hypothetical protein
MVFTIFVVMDALTQFELIAIAGSLIGIWIKHQADYSSLKSRVISLETDNSEMKEDIKLLLREVQEVKILLAKNQVQ